MAYTIALVDDEVLAIRGLRSGVRWEEIGIGEVLTAYSMRQTQQLFASQHIDILLCDIEMPNGSGVDLLKWVKVHHPDTVTIFLTCHASFAYAKEAVSLGAYDYLLKPVPYDRLSKVLASAVQRCDQLAEEKNNRLLRSVWLRNKGIIEQQFWFDVLEKQAFPTLREVLADAREKNISLREEDCYIPLLLHIPVFETLLQDWPRRQLEYALHNIFQEVFAFPGCAVTIVPVETGRYLVLLQSQRLETGDVLSACRQLCDHFQRFLSHPIHCRMGEPTPLANLAEQYERLKKHAVLPSADVTLPDTPAEATARRGEMGIDMTQWGALLAEGKSETLLGQVHSFLDGCMQNNTLSGDSLKQFYRNFIQMVYFVLFQHNISADELFSNPLLDDMDQKAFSSLEGFKAFVKRIVDQAAQSIDSCLQSRNVVERTKRFIQKNLDQNLTREALASHVNLNQDYLSRIFKQKMGMSLSQYLLQQRLTAAKQLLSGTDDSISQIAEKVGYGYISHFSKTFHRETGLSPLSYRKQNRRRQD